MKIPMLAASPCAITAATFKSSPADFIVTEHLGFDLSGDGEHLCLYIEKTNANTGYIAKKLSEWAGIPERDVGYSGLKDRFAITRQWFSLRLPKKIAPDTPFCHGEATVLSSTWHSKKIARGTHRSNAFDIILRHVEGDTDAIEQQLSSIASDGVPNYFGLQRFGHQGNNLIKVQGLFDGSIPSKRVRRNERGMLLSSARSFLFNAMLAERVKDGTWNQAVAGDVFNLDGSGSVFSVDKLDDDIIARVSAHDIHPTCAMWGRGELKTTGSILALEQRIAHTHDILSRGLESAGLKQERRATRLIPQNLSWACDASDDKTLSLHFSLPKGCYATSVLAALVATLDQPNR